MAFEKMFLVLCLCLCLWKDNSNFHIAFSLCISKFPLLKKNLIVLVQINSTAVYLILTNYICTDCTGIRSFSQALGIRTSIRAQNSNFGIYNLTHNKNQYNLWPVLMRMPLVVAWCYNFASKMSLFQRGDAFIEF